ncbi:glutamate--tRNA ligase [Pikeienuella sp. HZG-20]|uniref:glutamate--tRNA ligase n=1 Tax=Paludibacillus litoralis TaxID=3133267 RepID=UPI0030EC9088
MITTRFAPSPTGALHLGNLRTAVFNALLARKAGGRFILRIDDTDRERSQERHVDGIRRDLEWLGLSWDAEFRQSARIGLYEEAAARLKAEGRLYPCWESAADLALMRRRLRAASRPPIYDRAALRLSEAERAALLAERPPHWRFRLEPGLIEWDDGMRGPQRFEAEAISDPVLIREDGQFLYSLCSVVDDADMGVTDVVRGADHVTNTATQAQLFAALGAPAPRFAHHALMVGPGGEKLSKRIGGLSVAELREGGAEPAALISWLARIGSSLPVVPVWSVEAAAAGFDLSSFGLAPVRAAPEDIMHLSRKILHDAPFESVRARLPDDVSEAFWLAVRPNIERLEDVAEWRAVAAGAAPTEAETAPEDEEFVAQALALLPPRPWDERTWAEWTGAVKAATGRKGRALFQPLRRALTGRDHGPDMASFMPFLEGP